MPLEQIQSWRGITNIVVERDKERSLEVKDCATDQQH
jgi:hypothetical protein